MPPPGKQRRPFFARLKSDPIGTLLGAKGKAVLHLEKGRARRSVTLAALARRIYSEFSEDRVPAVAGGITFFFLLAVFPALACIVSLYGLFDDRGSLLEGLNAISAFLPKGAVAVLSAEVQRLVAQKPMALNLAVLFGFCVAVWSASGGLKALIDGLNIAFETAETRSLIGRTLSTLVLTLLALLLFSGFIYLNVSLQRFIATRPFGGVLQTLVAVLAWPIAFCLVSAVISLIYRYGPNRVRTPWRWITWGSAFASVFWLIGTLIFSFYAEHFASYNRTYGTLGAMIGFLTWVWLSLVLLLTGAEIVCELERKRAPKDGRPSQHKKETKAA
jgi:membrane protein